MLRRGGITEIACVPLLVNTTQVGFTVKKKATRSQLRALATHTPILGGVAQGALELGLAQISKCHFLSALVIFACTF